MNFSAVFELGVSRHLSALSPGVQRVSQSFRGASIFMVVTLKTWATLGSLWLRHEQYFELH